MILGAFFVQTPFFCFAQDTITEDSSPDPSGAELPDVNLTLDGDSPSVKAAETEKKKSQGLEPVSDKEKDIYLNFENTDLTNFINYVGELKKLNIILDKMLQGVKISLTIREPLDIQGAWNIFLTVLEMSGFTLVKRGEVYVVIPRDRKLMQALPSFINVSPEALPDSDLVIRYVLFLNNIQVADVRDLLVSMLSQPSNVIDHRDVNGFIITDKSHNIKAAAKLLKELDQMGLQETVTVLKLSNANALDTKNLLQSLIARPDGGALARLLGKTAEGSTEYFPPGTRIFAEERTNSLILLGTNQAIDKIVDFIKKHIDTTLAGTESPLHIYELKHTDVVQVADILREVTQPPSDFVPGNQAARYGAIRGGVKYFRSMQFQADRDGNRLIVSSTDKNDWELLKKTIQDLDKPQAQVAVETFIVTVDVNDNKLLAGAIRNKKHGMLGRHIDFQSAALGTQPSLEEANDGTPISLLGNMLSQLVLTQGTSALTFGKPTNIWAVFRALKTQTNARILSQPFLVIANKTRGTIEFGQERRVVNEESDGSIGAGFRTASASTNLDLRPQINLDGLVNMELTLNIDEFTDPNANSKDIKVLKTHVTVANGQVLVLGGFVRTKVTENKAKTPLLGDIPILGWLFKRQERTVTRSYVFVFLSPTIIKPRTAPGMQLYTKMKLHDATDEIEESVETKRTIDPVHNWFFNPDKTNYSHKVIDFANARYQPTTVDINNDAYYGLTPGEEDRLAPLEITPSSALDENVIVEGEPAMIAKAVPAIRVSEPQPLEKKKKIKKVSRKLPDLSPPPIHEALPGQSPVEDIPVLPLEKKTKSIADKSKKRKQSKVSGFNIPEKRQQLKQMLNEPSQKKQSVIAQKKRLNKKIAAPKGQERSLLEKRNQLKQLLAASPVRSMRKKVTI